MKQTLFKILATLILTGSIAIGWGWMDFNGFMNNRASIPEAGMDIDIVSGANLATVSQTLYQSGVFRSEFYPRLAGKIYPELTEIKQGEYHLDVNMTPMDIFQKLVKGEVISYQIQFIEGWTLKEFLTSLASESRLIHTIEGKSHQDLIKILPFISAEQFTYPNLEGLFYPDTYNYQRGSSDIQILQKSFQLMQQMLDKYWSERDMGLPYETAYEMLIMASIIEKETGLYSEREKIAGVFTRRLQKRMRLQTDPTVIYGMGDKYKGNIRRKDLLEKTPYNTYVIKGLPPTPIAMPSEASLAAAAHPAEGLELYFVARGDGSHQFSETLEEHNKAVRYFQLNKRTDK